MATVFIDGSAGTTGLRIYERLAQRKDIELIRLPEEVRKDTEARREAINQADIVFLCLPDAAAIEAVALLENPETVIIDTSTAHRTHPDWAYGFAELGKNRDKIKNAKRIANPGCHASGFIALVWPLIHTGILRPDVRLSCFSITGYSGGGKKMIAEYQSDDVSPLFAAPRQYGLSQTHKHLREMAAVAGLTNLPAFSPIVANFYSGMEVSIPLFAQDVKGNIGDIAAVYAEVYKEGLVHFRAEADENGFLSAAAYSGRDDMEVTVTGNEDRILLTARFDNLGKGASGAALQNMNIVLGAREAEGLIIG